MFLEMFLWQSTSGRLFGIARVDFRHMPPIPGKEAPSREWIDMVVDQSDGIRAIPGFGWAYGVDFHLATFRKSGPTASITGLHTAVEERLHHGFSGGLGYTFF